MTEEKSPLAPICWITTAILAAFLCFIQLGMMLSLLAGRIGIAWIAPLSLALALLLGDRLARQRGLSGTARLWPLASSLASLVASLALSAWYFDLSFDGQWYHQTAIYAIAQDWNPLTDPMREFVPSAQLWVRHYAKGPWYAAAAIYQTTGQIEWGKCPTLLALVAMGLSTLAACLDLGMRRTHAGAVALLVALNPVILSELTTYLVDGIMIGFLVVVAVALLSALKRPQAVLIWVGVLSTIVSINAKFTGLVFLCFVFAVGGLWYGLRQRERLRAYLGWTTLSLLLAVGVFGFNPYFTNTLHRQQPFYPVLGSTAYPSLTQQGREGIELYETPKNLMGRNRLYRLAYATFGRPSNAPYINQRDAHLMWPFTARPDDLVWYRYHETRVAGFGPLFSGILILAFGLGIWLLLRPGLARWVATLLALTILGSLLISLHLWWPRYGPQLWLLPIVPIAFIFWESRSRWALRTAWVLTALLLFNTGIVGGVRMAWETRASHTLRQQLSELRQSGKEIEINPRYFERAVEERLKSWGVRYQKRGRNELRDGLVMVSVVEGYPGVVRYRLSPSAQGTQPNRPN